MDRRGINRASGSTMTEVSIRSAHLGDVEAIARFAHPVVHDAYGATIGTEAADRLLAAWWGDTLTASIGAELVHVAVCDGDVVGMAERGVLDGDPIVWKLYVAAARRGEGIGSDLLHASIAAIGPGPARVILEHLASNTAAGRFYEREGFSVFRTEPSDDPADDLVWRARPLDRIDGVPGARLV